MTRFVALLIALLLPLQLSWGAVAAYCQHETAPKLAQHAGHHEHVHADAAPQAADGKLQIDSDCSACNPAAPHAFTAASADLPALPSAASLAAPPLATIGSAPARAPDRPQWPRLA